MTLDRHIGEVYNEYTVLEFSHKKGYHKIYKCKCSCGVIKDVYLCNLTSGHSRSCGHKSKIKPMKTGSKYGRWTVVNFAFVKNETAYWNCACECGTEKPVNGAMLRNGLSQSCGCLWKETMKKVHTKHGLCGTKKYRQWECRNRREIKKELDVNWTPEMEVSIRSFQKRCVLCRMSEEKHRQIWGTSLHVDHVNPLSSGHGLQPGNAVMLCNTCNSSKGSKNITELDSWIQLKLKVNANMFKIMYVGNFI